MLKKSTLREIRTSLARYLAIFAIVALGVGFFSGLKNTKTCMVTTATEYLKKHRLYDYMLISSYGTDDESIEIAEAHKGVSDAEGSVQIDVLAASGDQGDAALKAISLPGDINTLRVVSGRLPEASDECVVDDYHITDGGFRIGDKIVLSDTNDEDVLKEFKYKEFTIVGTVNTPIYMDYQRGSTDIGNGSLDTFFFIDRDAFDVDYYTQLYLLLDNNIAPFSDEEEDWLKEQEDDMEDLAEEITAARRETARKEAQDKLDKKIKKYEDSLADYNKEKADTEKKLRKAQKKINKGNSQIKQARKDIRAKIKEAKSGIKTADKTIKKLNSKKKEAEAGVAEAEAQKAAIKQAHAAGQMDDETYAASIKKVNAGIKQAKSGLKKINSGIRQAKAGKKKAKAGIAQAKSGLKELDKQEKKLKQAQKTLNSNKRKADREFAKAKKELDDAKEKLDEAQEKINDMETGNSYAFSRCDNAGYSSFDSNSSIVDNIAKIFPVFFFLIAALVVMTTMTRMVDEQRTQVGVLKALGYSNGQIAGKYLFYSGSAALLGAVTGFFAGCKIFPTVIWHAYTMMYDFSYDVAYVFDPMLFATAAGAALLCAMGATWVSIAKDFRAAPSELIRPKTPPAGKRILLEYITPLWKRVSFLYKVSLRNIFRDKKRFLMMVIGVSGCTALLIAAMGIRTTIAQVADHQYNEISLYDFVTVFSKNMTEKRKKDFLEEMSETGVSADEVKFLHQAEVTVLTDDGNYDVTCTASDPTDFGKYIDLHAGDQQIEFPGDGEAVIVRKLNHDYGIDVGDEITVRDGYRQASFRVSAVCDNYVNDSIYMSTDTYEKAFGKSPDIKSALVKLRGGSADGDVTEEMIRAAATQAANYENTAAVSVNLDVRENVGKMMESLDLIVYVVILSAALLAFIVLYNLTNINITERIREIATIKVLGFNQLEVSQYVFRENIFLTAIAALAGIPEGKWLLDFVVDNIVVKMIFFETRLKNTDILTAVALTFAFAFVVNLAMQRRLAAVSMTESLKSVE